MEHGRPSWVAIDSRLCLGDAKGSVGNWSSLDSMSNSGGAIGSGLVWNATDSGRPLGDAMHGDDCLEVPSTATVVWEIL